MKSMVIKLLHFLARRVVKKYKPTIVAITGSVGKTRTKDAVALTLAAKYKVRKSEGNYNTEWGAPLTILGARAPGRSPSKWLRIFLRAFRLLAGKKDYPQFLILEMGADKEGDIAQLLKIIAVQAAVITAIAPAHVEQFKNIDSIAREKGRLFRAVPRAGWLIVNQDDERVLGLASDLPAQKIFYSGRAESDADIKAAEINVKYGEDGTPLGMTFKIVSKSNVTPVLLAGVLGRHQVYPALAAAAAAKIFNINNVELAESLGRLPHLPGRMRILPGIKNTVIIDDTYNSSPAALAAALLAISGLSCSGRRLAVLGDMLELGAISESEHRQAGRLAAELKFDLLFTVGERAKDIARFAVASGLGENSVFSFGNTDEARLFVQERMKPDDIVLVKGSRALHLEKIVKEIMAQPERAGELLVTPVH